MTDQEYNISWQTGKRADVKRFLEALLPYLQVKHEKAATARAILEEQGA